MRDHKGWFLKGNYVLSKGQDMWEVTTSYVFEIYLSLYLLSSRGALPQMKLDEEKI